MDPYLELTIGGIQIHKTTVKKGAGKKPRWNEECAYAVRHMGVEMKIAVSDEEVFNDDLVGELTCTVGSLCTEEGTI